MTSGLAFEPGIWDWRYQKQADDGLEILLTMRGHGGKRFFYINVEFCVGEKDPRGYYILYFDAEKFKKSFPKRPVPSNDEMRGYLLGYYKARDIWRWASKE